MAFKSSPLLNAITLPSSFEGVTDPCSSSDGECASEFWDSEGDKVSFIAESTLFVEPESSSGSSDDSLPTCLTPLVADGGEKSSLLNNGASSCSLTLAASAISLFFHFTS